MGMDRAAASARAVPAEPSGEAGLTLAALIDVLDRADEVRLRTRPRRGAVHRSPSARAVADRWDPLRDLGARSVPLARRSSGTPSRSRAILPPAGTDRSAPRAVSARSVPLRSVPPAPPARLPVVVPPAPVPAPADRTAPAGRPVGVRLRTALAAVVRRAALWGAGPGGAHLAWNAPPPVRAYRPSPAAPARTVDPPVVLRELPSTPTTAPAPRAARPPAPPAAPPRPAAPVRRTPVRTLRTPALSTVRRIAPLPPAPGTVPSRARSPGGVRGSPGSARARGSPPWWSEPGRAPDARRGPGSLRGS